MTLGFSFGATSAGPTAATTTTTTGFSFGAPLAAKPADINLSLNRAPALLPTSSAGFSFGGAQQPSSGFGFGASGVAAAPAPAGIGVAPAAVATTASVGLGGKLQIGAGSAAGAISSSAADLAKADGKSAKETAVPESVVQTVDAFRAHVKAQKSECELISRHSWAAVQRAGEETAELRQLLAAVDASVQQHAAVAGKLKADVCDALKRAEVAQRTAETSAGLQYDNTAPQELFADLVRQYEAAMVQYRRHIDQLERLLGGAPGCVTPEELLRAIRQLHEAFVWLAGHLQTVHEKVQALKDHYRAYRRTVVGDSADVFAGSRPRAAAACPDRAADRRPGPSPFAVDRNAAAAAAAAVLGQAPPPPPPPPSAALLGGVGSIGLLGSATPTISAPLGGSSGLRLDPPPGTKRGKVTF